jgi:hypothetical protein
MRKDLHLILLVRAVAPVDPGGSGESETDGRGSHIKL